MILELTGAAALGIWIYLLLARGAFWREFGRDAKAPPGPASPPSIAAIVPARNEAALVGRAVRSLAAQQYAGRFHIVLVDDHSTDGTAGAAYAAAGHEALTVVQAGPLPRGWTGKLWAVSEGIRHAAASAPDYYLLTDADIVHPPDSLNRLASRAAAGEYDLVSFMVRLACETPAEHALIPAFVFFFFMLYPPAWVRNRGRRTAAAAGGCLLIRREALERIGGIQAVRGAWIDDCALAGAVKSHGGRVWLGLDSDTRSVRAYETFGEVGRMISRSAFTQLRHSGTMLAGAALGLVLTFLAPPLLALLVPGRAAMLGGAAWLLMSLAYLPAVRYYRQSWVWAPVLPLVAAFYLGATIHSAFAYWFGAGSGWKGRKITRTSAP
jgi:hopene-associated glycosyltransferase HpnB